MKQKLLKKTLICICALTLLSNVAFMSAKGSSLDAKATYSTIIMQGNTESKSDCQEFRNRLLTSGYGYTVFGLRGWQNNIELTDDSVRVTEAQFLEMKNYDVAYYSGHGGFRNGYPVVNYKPSNLNYDYGISSEINVAQALGVSTSDWQTDSYIKPTDPLRVLVLASCSQLDSSIVKYYARIMKASKIRAIAGYHDTAPAAGDDTIARNFVDLAKEGNSVWYSWQNSNPGQNWAVLVYQENYNQYYRFPGFPGNTYADPSSDANVYRYANFLSSPSVTPLTSTGNIEQRVTTLPATITAVKQQSRTNYDAAQREVRIGEYSVIDDDTQIKTYLTNNFSVQELEDKICVQFYTTEELVDEEEGIIADTRKVVERTYNYYDSISGVKIVDSYIGASIDSAGIKNVIDERRIVTNIGEPISANQNYIRASLVSVDSAIEKIRTAKGSNENLEIKAVSFAYVPVENDIYQLCYEIRTEYGFHYINVLTGEQMYIG